MTGCMSGTHDFIKYCVQVLEVNFGQLSGEIISKVKARKNLNYQSGIRDFKEFIDQIEFYIRVISGENKATDVCSVLITKAVEIMEKQKTPSEKLNPTPRTQVVEGITDEEIESLPDQFIELTTPCEKDIRDTLEGLGLKHMIRER